MILLLIIVVGVAPWGVGMLVEQRYNEIYDHLSKVRGKDFQITTEYTRGYLISLAKTEITHVPTGQKVSFIDTIHNGPLIFNFTSWSDPKSYIPVDYKLAAIDTRLIGPAQQALQDMYGDKPAYDIHSTIAFDGSVVSVAKLLPLHKSEHGIDFDWDGATYTVNINSDYTNFTADLVIPVATFTAGNNVMKFSNITAQHTHDLLAHTNTFNFVLADATAHEGDTSTFELKNAAIKGNGALVNDLMTGELTFTFDMLNTASEKYGPGSLNIKSKNINLTLADELSAAQETNDETDQKLVQLLNSTPTFDVTLKETLPQGDVNMVTHIEVGGPDLKDVKDGAIYKTLKLTLDAKAAIAIVDFILTSYLENEVQTKQTLYFIMNKDKPDAAPNPYLMSDDEMHKFAADTIAKWKQYLVDNKFVTESGTDYMINVQIADEKVTINGQEKTPDDMQKLQDSMEINIAPVAPPAPATTAPATTPDTGTTSGATATPPAGTTPPATATPPTTDAPPKTATPPASSSAPEDLEIPDSTSASATPQTKSTPAAPADQSTTKPAKAPQTQPTT